MTRNLPRPTAGYGGSSMRKTSLRSASAARASTSGASTRSSLILDFHDLFFFGVDERIDILDVLIGQLLELIGSALVFVFRDLVIFEQRFDRVDALVTNIADRHLALFAAFVDDLDQI